jgi:uncharacterized membrane protein YkoI
MLIGALLLLLGVVSAGLAVAAGGGAAPSVETHADSGDADDDDPDTDGQGQSEANDTADSDDAPLAGQQASRASEAALRVTGGGTVVHVESDDGGTGYEVEVRTSDGSVSEVELDGSLARGTAEPDDD